jgi:sigma-B regulation protein RsbU (phosphoserine phosphatase)
MGRAWRTLQGRSCARAREASTCDRRAAIPVGVVDDPHVVRTSTGFAPAGVRPARGGTILFMDTLATQISPTDLRGILRADAVGLALGVLLVVAGLLVLVLWAGARRRASSLPGRAAGGGWLGLFALLYGLRLLARTGTVPLYFDAAPIVWDYLEAAITYSVPLPLLLFLRDFVPSGRRFTISAAVVVAVFAVYAITSDAVLHRPHSARTLNNLIAIVLLCALLVLFFRGGLSPSPELRIARGGILAVSLTALADNLRGIQVLEFPGPELEPFGFTLLVVCLGTLAVRRVIGEARRLTAIDRELTIARQIQSSILPQTMPRVPGLSVAARYRPMTAVAGDFYDFLEMDRLRVGVLVADVSGHGVPAALLASMVKVALAGQRERADRPAAVLAGMNDVLCGALAGQFVTAAYLFIDTGSGVIRYAAAGHPPMLRTVRPGRDVDEVERNGFALGFLNGAAYEEMELALQAGDRFLLYTDGLIESARDDDLFGLERLKASLADGGALHPDAAADNLLATVDAWSGQPPGDDFTVVLADWMPGDSSVDERA